MKTTPSKGWRYGTLATLLLGSIVIVVSLEPIQQDLAYHNFADKRAFLGIPNFIDTLSNLPFSLVGVLGLYYCAQGKIGSSRTACISFFAGSTLVGMGSAYYHLAPDNVTLVWDRLPMTVAFMVLLAALIGEFVSDRLARWILAPAVAFGMTSVFYWQRTGDLRFYAWVQFFPLLILPALMLLFESRYGRTRMLTVALGLYLLAKITEHFDAQLFGLTEQVVSGHAMKHLLAAAGCWCILPMLKKCGKQSPIL